MVVAPVAYVPSHVHERLLGKDLAVVPAPDRHGRCLVADCLDFADVAAPSGEQFVGILAQAQGVSEPLELADLVEHCDDLVSVMVERDGRGAAPETSADDDYYAKLVRVTLVDVERGGADLAKEGCEETGVSRREPWCQVEKS